MRVLRVAVVWSFAGLALGVVGLLAAGGAGASAAEGVRTGPAGAAFYRPPASLPRVHGAPIWMRAAQGGVRLSAGARTWLVLYRSTSLDGRPVAVSGSIAIPRGTPPRGGWPVVSWAPGTTGVAARCAATRIPGSEVVNYVVPELNSWLRRGGRRLRRARSAGGRLSYLIGHAEARGVLDIVRAARAIDARIGRRLVIAGIAATLFAAADAPHWVPELRLRGVAALAPANHLARGLRPILAMTKPSAVSAIVAATLASMGEYASPPLSLPQVLTPRALCPRTDLADPLLL